MNPYAGNARQSITDPSMGTRGLATASERQPEINRYMGNITSNLDEIFSMVGALEARLESSVASAVPPSPYGEPAQLASAPQTPHGTRLLAVEQQTTQLAERLRSLLARLEV